MANICSTPFLFVFLFFFFSYTSSLKIHASQSRTGPTPGNSGLTYFHNRTIYLILTLGSGRTFIQGYLTEFVYTIGISYNNILTNVPFIWKFYFWHADSAMHWTRPAFVPPKLQCYFYNNDLLNSKPIFGYHLSRHSDRTNWMESILIMFYIFRFALCHFIYSTIAWVIAEFIEFFFFCILFGKFNKTDRVDAVGC